MSTSPSPPPEVATRTEERHTKRRRLSTENEASPSNESEHEQTPQTPSNPQHTPQIEQHEPVDEDIITYDREDAHEQRDTPDESDHTHLAVPNGAGHFSRKSSPASSDRPDSDIPEHSSSAIPTPSSHHYATEIRYKPQLTLRGHKRGVSAVKFSPNGKWVASCSADATCRIWDAWTGKPQYTLQGHLAGISTIAFSPDSNILASGSDDKTIRLWDVPTGKAHPEPLLGHHNYVFCVAFSPKGNMLVSGSHDEAVFLWDVRSGRLMRSLPAHSDPVCGVDFVRDGTLIVSCSSDGLIRVWDTATGQCLRTFFHEDTPPVVSVQFSPNGKYILAWMLDSCLRMWNYVEGRCVKTYQGHVNVKYSLNGCFGSYGIPPTALVASGSEDGSVVIWDVVSKTVLQRLEGHDGPVMCVDMHPTQKTLVSCGLDGTIRMWKDSEANVHNTNYEDMDVT